MKKLTALLLALLMTVLCLPDAPQPLRPLQKKTAEATAAEAAATEAPVQDINLSFFHRKGGNHRPA